MPIRVNNIWIGGAVGRDPEIKFLQDGKKVANLSIAVDNGKNKETDWFDVTAWEAKAEIIEQFVCKGSVVIINGSIHQRKWEDKDGVKHTKYVVTANDIQLAGGKRKENSGNVGAAVINDEDIPF